MSLCISFLTGQSNSNSCALSPEQENFLHALDLKDVTLQPNNFPYIDNLPGFNSVGIVRASLSNVRQYFASRHQAFLKRYRTHIENLIDSHSRVLLLAGSCGLELLNNLRLSAGTISRIEVLAYGPVARSYTEAKLTIVQGRRDYLSQFYFPSAHYRIDCGHLGYLQSAEFLAIARSIAHEFVQGRS